MVCSSGSVCGQDVRSERRRFRKAVDRVERGHLRVLSHKESSDTATLRPSLAAADVLDIDGSDGRIEAGGASNR